MPGCVRDRRRSGCPRPHWRPSFVRLRDLAAHVTNRPPAHLAGANVSWNVFLAGGAMLRCNTQRAAGRKNPAMRSTPGFRFQLRQLMLVVLLCSHARRVAWVRAKRDKAQGLGLCSQTMSQGRKIERRGPNVCSPKGTCQRPNSLLKDGSSQLKLKMSARNSISRPVIPGRNNGAALQIVTMDGASSVQNPWGCR